MKDPTSRQIGKRDEDRSSTEDRSREERRRLIRGIIAAVPVVLTVAAGSAQAGYGYS